MFEMNCPSCGKGMKWWFDGLVRVKLNSRICSNCGIKLELLNPGLCYFVNGIIFAGILMGVVFRNLPILWLWILFGGVFCWFINPVIVRMLGRWGIWSYHLEQTAKVRFLMTVSTVSTIIAGIWVAYMAFWVLRPYWKLLANFDITDNNAMEAIEKYTTTFTVKAVIGISIGVGSIVVNRLASAKRAALRAAAIMRSLEKAQVDGK